MYYTYPADQTRSLRVVREISTFTRKRRRRFLTPRAVGVEKRIDLCVQRKTSTITIVKYRIIYVRVIWQFTQPMV